MINFNINEGHVTNLEVKGEVYTLSAEISILISRIYKQIRKDNETEAEMFKRLIVDKIEVPFMSSEEIRKEALKLMLQTLFGNNKEDT